MNGGMNLFQLIKSYIGLIVNMKKKNILKILKPFDVTSDGIERYVCKRCGNLMNKRQNFCDQCGQQLQKLQNKEDQCFL